MTTAQLRVMTMDVASFRGDADAMAVAIIGAEPDVVAVLGAPRYLRWRSRRAALARQCGLVVATADRPGGLFLMASLRAAVVETSFALLPLAPRGRRRSVVTAVLDTLGAQWRVAVARLAEDPGERASQAAALHSALFGPSVSTAPLILAGELGEPADGSLEAAFRDRLALAVADRGQVILAEPSLTVASTSTEPRPTASFAQ